MIKKYIICITLSFFSLPARDVYNYNMTQLLSYLSTNRVIIELDKLKNNSKSSHSIHGYFESFRDYLISPIMFWNYLYDIHTAMLVLPGKDEPLIPPSIVEIVKNKFKSEQNDGGPTALANEKEVKEIIWYCELINTSNSNDELIKNNSLIEKIENYLKNNKLDLHSIVDIIKSDETSTKEYKDKVAAFIERYFKHQSEKEEFFFNNILNEVFGNIDGKTNLPNKNFIYAIEQAILNGYQKSKMLGELIGILTLNIRDQIKPLEEECITEHGKLQLLKEYTRPINYIDEKATKDGIEHIINSSDEKKDRGFIERAINSVANKIKKIKNLIKEEIFYRIFDQFNKKIDEAAHSDFNKKVFYARADAVKVLNMEKNNKIFNEIQSLIKDYNSRPSLQNELKGFTWNLLYSITLLLPTILSIKKLKKSSLVKEGIDFVKNIADNKAFFSFENMKSMIKGFSFKDIAKNSTSYLKSAAAGNNLSSAFLQAKGIPAFLLRVWSIKKFTTSFFNLIKTYYAFSRGLVYKKEKIKKISDLLIKIMPQGSVLPEHEFIKFLFSDENKKNIEDIFKPKTVKEIWTGINNAVYPLLNKNNVNIAGYDTPISFSKEITKKVKEYKLYEDSSIMKSIVSGTASLGKNVIGALQNIIGEDAYSLPTAMEAVFDQFIGAVDATCAKVKMLQNPSKKDLYCIPLFKDEGKINIKNTYLPKLKHSGIKISLTANNVLIGGSSKSGISTMIRVLAHSVLASRIGLVPAEWIELSFPEEVFLSLSTVDKEPKMTAFDLPPINEKKGFLENIFSQLSDKIYKEVLKKYSNFNIKNQESLIQALSRQKTEVAFIVGAEILADKIPPKNVYIFLVSPFSGSTEQIADGMAVKSLSPLIEKGYHLFVSTHFSTVIRAMEKIANLTTYYTPIDIRKGIFTPSYILKEGGSQARDNSLFVIDEDSEKRSWLVDILRSEK